MKILIITMSASGGMRHYVSQLANSLSKKENVSVIVPEGANTKDFSRDVTVINLKLGNTVKNFIINTILFSRLIKFYRTIGCENPDVIHFNNCNLWIALVLLFLRKFKLVTMIHDVNPHMGTRKWDQIIAKKIFIKFSDAIIVHGENAKKLINNNKCYQIPIGDFAFFLKYKKEKIEEEDYTLLFFGRIEEYKGLEYLITAVNEVSRHYPNVKLIIAGAGNLDKYRQLFWKNINFEVHNRFIPDDEVPIFFQRAKIIVLPYIECTQTGIIPIAYAFKKPVITTNVGSIPELVDDGKTGFIVPVMDPKALRNKIINLISDEHLRIKMGENAYIKMRKDMSWDKISDNLIKIYNKIS